jgi:hypothetical protein
MLRYKVFRGLKDCKDFREFKVMLEELEYKAIRVYKELKDYKALKDFKVVKDFREFKVHRVYKALVQA